jgi:MFS-type transporter involved in bile tolerance (Atg22 family)
VYHLTGDLRNTILALATMFVLGGVLLVRVPANERAAAA